MLQIQYTTINLFKLNGYQKNSLEKYEMHMNRYYYD